MNPFLALLPAIGALLMAGGALAQAPREAPPPELLAQVPKNAKYVAHATADLNGDGRPDYVMVVEPAGGKPAAAGEAHRRPLLVVVRQADGSLATRKTNDRVILCSTCGGTFGDPFDDVTASKNSFTVHHYGGSADRWMFEYQFNYSRRDDSWQLVKVLERAYHTSNPNKQQVKTYRPPADFGLIDITEFDPENFKGAGKR